MKGFVGERPDAAVATAHAPIEQDFGRRDARAVFSSEVHTGANQPAALTFVANQANHRNLDQVCQNRNRSGGRLTNVAAGRGCGRESASCMSESY
jgi:hypothetical protein